MKGVYLTVHCSSNIDPAHKESPKASETRNLCCRKEVNPCFKPSVSYLKLFLLQSPFSYSKIIP